MLDGLVLLERLGKEECTEDTDVVVAQIKALNGGVLFKDWAKKFHVILNEIV